MQSAAISFSPTISLSNDPRNNGFNPMHLALYSERRRIRSVSASLFSSGPSTRISYSLSLSGWVFSQNPVTRSDVVPVRATAESGESAETPKSKSADTLVLGILFGFWYLFNIYFNIYNKQLVISGSQSLSLPSDGFSISICCWDCNCHFDVDLEYLQAA